MIAIIRINEKSFVVEPVQKIKNHRVLVRVGTLPTWAVPFDLVYGENPLRLVPVGSSVTFAACPECGEFAGRTIEIEKEDD